MSRLGLRLAASAAALWLIGGVASLSAVADALPDSTWVSLGPLPHQGRSALFALAVDPANNQNVLAGTSDGTLLRSTNGGGSWAVARSGRSAVIAISFSPNTGGLVLAGTRGGGALLSHDSGATWTVAAGLETRSVKAFAFSLTIMAAGTDKGVFISDSGSLWTPSTLVTPSIDTVAVEAIHTPVRLVAGSDTQASGGGLPLFQSLDGGATWTTLTPPLSGSIIVRLVAGPLPASGNVRPLAAGTNGGLFLSTDNGATFSALSGGALLPTTDFTQVAFISNQSNRFYAGSDGGGSNKGGLWRTDNGGQDFVSMQPPQPSVTALAVSSDAEPTLYVATFQPATHVATLWTYHDTGAPPQGPPSAVSPIASGARSTAPDTPSALEQLISSPQIPYAGLGLGALAVVLTAVAAHLRGRRR